MPVLNQTPVITYTGNGSVKTFAYPFQILTSTDLKVYSNGSLVATGYSVTGVGNAGGGSVVFTVAPLAGVVVRLIRETSINRTTDYVEGGAVTANVLDTDFDRTVMMIQEQQSLMFRENSAGNLDATGRRVVNVAEPVASSDAATKNFVETAASSQVVLATTQAGNASASASAAATSASQAAASAVLAASYSSGWQNSNNVFIGTNSFSQSPTVPTATAGDATTKVASTQFVTSAVAAAVPSQTSNADKFLTTNGTDTSWGLVSYTPPKRQTVLSGPASASGAASFGGTTGTTTANLAGTIRVTGAYGTSDRTVVVSNPTWTGINSTGPYFLYIDIAANGTTTTGSTTLPPVYQWGGTASITNNQHTYNIQEGVMYVGNGSTASQVCRVFIGEVSTIANVVSSYTWYAIMGRHTSSGVFTLLSTQYNRIHQLGVSTGVSLRFDLVCLTADGGYSVGDVVFGALTGWNPGTYVTTSQTLTVTGRNNCSWTSGPTYYAVTFNKTSGAFFGITGANAANWEYRIFAERTW